MSENAGRQKTLLKARKAAKAVGVMLICGGLAIVVVGIASAYLPTVLNGMILVASSCLPFFVSARTKKKLDDLGV